MILQNLLWPKINICMEERMYFRANSKVQRCGEAYFLQRGGEISTDTYFNSVSVDKWHKYTNTKGLTISLMLQGTFKVSLIYKKKLHAKIYENIVDEKFFCEESVAECVLTFPDGEGMACFRLESLKDNSEFLGGYYSTNISNNQIQEIKIGIGICTFKREKFVEDNLKILNQYILENKNSELNGHLEVFISDNGQTLDIETLSTNYIHIVKNKNTGGAGGFTRNLIEILERNKMGLGITHALLMDDDITIDPEALLKTYRLLRTLKGQYKDAFIGGAMLRNDIRDIQVESGASWNGGKLNSLKSGLKMSNCEACLDNEIEEYSEYNAWWYCCFPMGIVTESNLPLPIFIRGDDLEYGLRNMKHLILMNGICVWHEPFENKYSSFLSYYILRNQFIDNALHFPDYTKKEAKKQIKNSIVREILFFRYKNVDLIVRGIQDYLAGIDWLLQTDGEALHKEIMAAGYKTDLIENLPVPFIYSQYKNSFSESDRGVKRWLRLFSLNGYFLPVQKNNIVSMSEIRPYNAFRAKRILNYDVTNHRGFITERNLKSAVDCVKKMIFILWEMDRKYNKITYEFRERIKEVQNIGFWRIYLGIEKDKEYKNHEK